MQLNLKGKSFNESIRYLLDKDKNPLHITCSDKLQVKDYINEKLNCSNFTIKTFELSDSLKGLDKKIQENPNHPLDFYLKCNNDSGGVCYFKSGEPVNTNILKYISSRRHHPYGVEKGEWFYQHIPYKCFTEEAMGGNLVDYKWHCSNGKARVCQIIGNRQMQTTEICTDLKGTELDFHFDENFKKQDVFPRPKNWNKMIELSNLLSKDFTYVRVDMYNIDGAIYIGELTFAPRAGRYSGEGQKKMGELLW